MVDENDYLCQVCGRVRTTVSTWTVGLKLPVRIGVREAGETVHGNVCAGCQAELERRGLCRATKSD